MQEKLDEVLTAIRELRQERIDADHDFATTHREHHEFIKTLIEHQRVRNAFWNSLLEKSFPAIVWTALVAMAVAAGAWIRSHVNVS